MRKLMEINIEKNKDEIILNITCAVYNGGRRNPSIIREGITSESALSYLKERGYEDYVLHPNSITRIDNKFTSPHGSFKFIKLEKKTVDTPNLPVVSLNNGVANSLTVSKKRTRKRRKTTKK
jgi:hypothetical protein